MAVAGGTLAKPFAFVGGTILGLTAVCGPEAAANVAGVATVLFES